MICLRRENIALVPRVDIPSATHTPRSCRPRTASALDAQPQAHDSTQQPHDHGAFQLLPRACRARVGAVRLRQRDVQLPAEEAAAPAHGRAPAHQRVRDNDLPRGEQPTPPTRQPPHAPAERFRILWLAPGACTRAWSEPALKAVYRALARHDHGRAWPHPGLPARRRRRRRRPKAHGTGCAAACMHARAGIPRGPSAHALDTCRANCAFGAAGQGAVLGAQPVPRRHVPRPAAKVDHDAVQRPQQPVHGRCLPPRPVRRSRYVRARARAAAAAIASTRAATASLVCRCLREPSAPQLPCLRAALRRRGGAAASSGLAARPHRGAAEVASGGGVALPWV